MVSANNAAESLHSVLTKVYRSGGSTVGAGWEAALGSPHGTPEFIPRHAEIVSLFQTVHCYLLALSEDHVYREIYEKYLPAWYRAIVFPDSWGSTSQPASKIISEPVLDQLRSLGAHMRRRTVSLDLPEDRLQTLRESLAEWRALLDDSELPPDLADQIKSQVDHIEWLLNNVSTFGTEPIVTGVHTLLGLSVPVLQMGGKWPAKIAAAVAALVIFLAPVADATEHVKEIAGNLSATVTEIQKVWEPQKELTSGDKDNEGEQRSIEAPSE